MDKRGKKIFVLAGGDDQISLMKELRIRFDCAEISLIDMAKDTIATRHADKHFIISTLDIETVLKLAKEENIDLIITACGDQTMPTMAYVSEQMKLPCYLTYNQSINLTNKLHMKRLMVENSIPTSNYLLLENYNEHEDLDIKLSYPLVVKPVDNNGSKGIMKVYEKAGLKKAINKASKFTRTHNIIIEEFRSGEEYSIEAFILNGSPHIILETKLSKIKQNTENFTILKCTYPCKLSDIISQKIMSIITQIGKAFEIENGPLMIQLIVNGEDVNVIEFSARTGGGSKHHFIRELTGVNVFENLLDITFGITPKLSIIRKNKFAAIDYVYVKPGIFSGVKNLDFLKHQGIVHDYFFYKLIGTKIENSDISSDRPVGFFVMGDTEEDLNIKTAFIDKTIQVLNDNNEDIMIHGLYK
jgi:biotin carboxylase